MQTLVVDGKTCSQCGEHKPLDAFYPNKKGLHGRHSRCKPCGNRATVVSRGKDRERERAYNNARYRERAEHVLAVNRQWRYGITPEEFAALLGSQGGRCAICRCEPVGSGITGKLHVDHDHETGRVRGLLCQRCNLGIGHLREDPEVLRAAIAYLVAA